MFLVEEKSRTRKREAEKKAMLFLPSVPPSLQKTRGNGNMKSFGKAKTGRGKEREDQIV